MGKLRSMTGFIPISVFIFVTALAIILYESSLLSLQKGMQSTFRMYTKETANAITVRMGTYEQVLRGVEGFLSANKDTITREMWEEYASTLELSNLYPGVQAIGFAKIVKQSELESHINDVRRSGVFYYRVHPEQKKDYYVPVMMMYPEDRINLKVMGYDLSSEPVRSGMLKEAGESGKTALTGKMVLKQEADMKNPPSGVLMAMPVYRHGELYGYVAAPFRMNDLMRGIFGTYVQGLSLKIYDTEVSPANLMYSTGDSGEETIMSAVLPVAMYGRTWHLKFDAGEVFFSQFDRSKPLQVLVGGVLTGFLLAMLSYILLKTRSRAYEMAEQMAQRFYESEERYRRTFEQAAVGIVMTSLDGRFMKPNSCFCRITGYTVAELLKKTMLDITYVKDLKDNEGCGTDLIAGRTDTYVTERRLVRKDGSIIWAVITASVLKDNEGAPKNIIMVVEDISRKKNTEDALINLNTRLTAIIENSLVGIIQVRERRFQWANNAFLEIFGYRSEDIIGKSTMAIHPDEKHYEDFGRFVDSELVFSKNGYASVRTEMRKCDGSLVWVEMAGKRIKDEDGEPCSVWVVMDVTERKLAEDRLLELNNTLESKVAEETHRRIEQERLFMQQGRLAAMGEMIGAIAHQWRQPLNVMALMVQNIQEEYELDMLDRDIMKEFADISMKQILFMSNTIDDFRNFFRTDKERVEFSAVQQISAVIDLVNQQFTAHNIKVRIVRHADAILYGVANEFAQVILNLLSNSKDAFLLNHRSDPEIKIEISCSEGVFRITVADNAGGIADDISDKIFDPYFTTKGPEKGTGIGLYMSKLIINDHYNGVLSFRNCEEGAEFIIELPVVSCCKI